MYPYFTFTENYPKDNSKICGQIALPQFYLLLKITIFIILQIKILSTYNLPLINLKYI
jgi:hypothetical protein